MHNIDHLARWHLAQRIRAVAYQENLDNGDPHEEILRLEKHIEELAAKIESCRKFILASRIAVAGCGLVGRAMLDVVVAADDHIVLAVGCDYSDVAPMDGVIVSSAAQRISVAASLQ